MEIATFILIVLLLVAASGILVRFVPAPLPIIQIALGVALAWPTDGFHVRLEPEIFLLVFVPPLLFIEGFLVPKREFSELAVPIFGLAFGLVFLTVVVFGCALNWLIPAMPLPVAFALAAVLSPTDAVAVSSIMGRGQVPARVRHILEGESLLNDASGLVVFRFAVAAALTGHFSLGETALTFVMATLGGAVSGIAMLWLTAAVLRFVAKIGDIRPEVQVVVMFLLPFAAYLLAEHFGASGILAAVTAGLYISQSGVVGSMSIPARMQNFVLVELLSFVFNGAIFLLLGMQLPDIVRNIPVELSISGRPWEPVVAVVVLTLILLAIRYAWMSFGSLVRATVNRLRGRQAERLTGRLRVVATLAGVRGAITLAGILSLPFALPDGSPFPARNLAIFIAAGVILCSLLLATLTLPAIARGIPLEEDDVLANERRLARMAAAEAAITRIEQMVDESSGDPDLHEARQAAARHIIPLYRQRLVAGEVEESSEKDRSPAVEEMHRAALEAERTVLVKLLRERKINDTTMRSIISEVTLDEALLALRKK
jgi:CPA1 family monovalent cation:H+ antiporter